MSKEIDYLVWRILTLVRLFDIDSESLVRHLVV